MCVVDKSRGMRTVPSDIIHPGETWIRTWLWIAVESFALYNGVSIFSRLQLFLLLSIQLCAGKEISPSPFLSSTKKELSGMSPHDKVLHVRDGNFDYFNVPVCRNEGAGGITSLKWRPFYTIKSSIKFTSNSCSHHFLLMICWSLRDTTTHWTEHF